MTAVPAQVPPAEPADSLEERWFVRGPLGQTARDWFGRSPARAGAGPVSRGGGLHGRAHEADADGTRFWTVGLEASGPALLTPLPLARG